MRVRQATPSAKVSRKGQEKDLSPSRQAAKSRKEKQHKEKQEEKYDPALLVFLFSVLCSLRYLARSP
jgi:hypothetical protein